MNLYRGGKIVSENMYYDSEEIEEVSITWNEDGYKRITVSLKSGEEYTVESD